jgi:hypothetical protein
LRPDPLYLLVVILDDEQPIVVTGLYLKKLEEQLLVFHVVKLVVLGEVVLDTSKLVLNEVF